MELNRRNLFKTSVIAAGALTVGLPDMAESAVEHKHTHSAQAGKSFNPAKEPIRTRKNFSDLTDEELRNLCRAIGYMRGNYPLEHPLQWDNYARLHALHCTEVSPEHPAVHWSWNFLPWHRGYLYFLERILANILTTQFNVDGNQFSLPYWDWSTREMPNTNERRAAGIPSPFFGYDITKENMVSDDGLGFDNSALYEGNRGPSLAKPQMTPANELTDDSKDHVLETLHYTSPEYISYMLAAPFEQFGGKPVTDRQTGQGLLEQGPHNDGHDWIGTRIGRNRTMGTLRSAAADPMFYMHHGNIDRIWSLYKQPQPDPAGPWGEQKYNFLDVDGSTFTLSVREIIAKTTNVRYAQGATELRAPQRPVRTSRPATVSIMKQIESAPITVQVPAGFFGHEALLVDVQTGPIAYTGKYTIKVYTNGNYVGKLKMLDGEHRSSYAKQDITHTFSLLLTKLPAAGDTLTFVPPTRGAIKIMIKSLEYNPL
jgi:hypothetical protein